MKYEATLPLEHVSEVISTHLRDHMEKTIREALNKEVMPMIRDMAHDIAMRMATDCLVNAGQDDAGKLIITVKLAGE